MGNGRDLRDKTDGVARRTSVTIKKRSLRKQIVEYIKYGCNCIFRYSQCLFAWIPCKDNRICCITLTRKGYVDNMRYVSQALLERHGDLEVIWITKYPETCSSAVHSGIRVIPYHTLRHFYLQFTSKIIISDDSLYHGLAIRKKQVYINVWHGGINYKQLGREGILFEEPLMKKIFELKNPSPDYMVAGSRFFAENMKAAFGFDKTVFLESGLPRNDVLFHRELLQGNVKKFYGIENKKIILYAPTFRERENCSIIEGIFFGMLTEAAQKRYGGEWTVLCRAHYFEQGMRLPEENAIDASGYENMQELLIDADILISDYSSCMWDFSFLYRPVIMYAPDEEDYCMRERGLTEAGKCMPYPKAKSMGELLWIMEKYDFAANMKSYREHHTRMGAYDTGSATGYITDLILSKVNGDWGGHK